AREFTNRQIIDKLGGLPAPKIHCSILAEQALKEALDDYMNKLKKE
ncbi:MAG: iron-sulfur cluster assembly scaffold protein, partial [Clostridiales bacterium]|nr:iron-sulfur cluster assembly scaffold protein [Clostridiales bacterium]